jgi:hypothetical protein
LTSARSLLPSTILAAVAALAFTASAQAGAWLPAPGEYHSEIRSGIAASNEWFDDAGTKQPLVGGGRLDATQAVFSAEFGWKKNRSFFMSLPLASVHRHVEDPSGFSATESGLSDMTVGLRFKIHQKRAALSLDLGWIAPLGYTRDYALRDASGASLDVTGAPGDPGKPGVVQYAPTLGDGSQRVFGTLNWGTPMGQRGFLGLAVGYRWTFPTDGSWQKWTVSASNPDQAIPVGPRKHVITRADLGVWLGSRLLVGGTFEGLTRIGSSGSPVVKDIGGGLGLVTGEKRPLTPEELATSYSAGPVVRLRVDDRCDVFAGSMHTLSGKNVLRTNQVYGGIAFKLTKLDRLQGWLGNAHKP